MDESFTLFSFISLLFLFTMFHFSSISAINSTQIPLCRDDERSALFQFKESFIIDKGRASSNDPFVCLRVEPWKLNDDCCSWDGVECDHLTRHVIGLDLSSSCLYGSISSSSSLFRLVHLRKLNLAFNHFNYSQIPPAVGLLSKLVSLNMSNSFLSGPIPSNVSYLSSLTSLDFSLNDQLSLQPSDFRDIVNNLAHSLEVLILSGVNISSHVPAILANTSSLSYLALTNCGLYGEFPVEIFHLPKLKVLILSSNENLRGYLPEFHSTSPLRILGLSYTSFSSEIPGSIGNLYSLTTLSLNDCAFSGKLKSSLGNLTKLSYLSLSHNPFDRQQFSSLSWLARLTKLVGLSLDNANLYGGFPSWFANLTQLSYLTLSTNQLRGPLPTSLINLIELRLENTNFYGKFPNLANFTQLSMLTLRANKLVGPFPTSLVNLTELTYLDLSDNGLQGSIPKSISQLRNLQYLNLQGNRLQGSIPNSISQLRNLELLNLHENSFSGTLELDTFLKFEKLQYIHLSYNNLTLLPNTGSNKTFQKFRRIGFADCKLDVFPDFLRYQDKLQFLDLSKNNIAGLIPKWLWNASADSLQLIDFSYNSLTGFEAHPILLPWIRATEVFMEFNMLQSSPPLPPPSIEIYYVRDNNLTGEIPPSFCNLTSLYVLEMGFNQLSGRLPSCLGNFSTHMEFLSLRGNGFYGTIPLTFSSGSSWKMIQLSDNQFRGKVPRSLANCAKLEFLDIGNNQIRDVFPSWLGPLPNLKVLILSSNQFHGVLTDISAEFDFQKLRIVDLSRNNFTGQLPTQYFFNWAAMKVVHEDQLTYMSISKSPYYIDFYSMLITSKGTERRYVRILENLVVVDLSCNKFEGEIPGVIGSLQGLRLLNLSHNNLSGDIPSTLANLTHLESLDLSQNKLSGRIPQQLAQLNSLAVFNVSHNLLTGPIPQGKQFNTFQDDSYQENLGLCGNPLSKKCGSMEAPPKFPPGLDDEDDSSSLLRFGWESVVIGYTSGLVFGLVIGYIVVTKHFEWFAKFFNVRIKQTSRARSRRGRLV